MLKLNSRMLSTGRTTISKQPDWTWQRLTLHATTVPMSSHIRKDFDFTATSILLHANRALFLLNMLLPMKKKATMQISNCMPLNVYAGEREPGRRETVRPEWKKLPGVAQTFNNALIEAKTMETKENATWKKHLWQLIWLIISPVCTCKNNAFQCTLGQ